jgi:hypothetical protein
MAAVALPQRQKPKSWESWISLVVGLSDQYFTKNELKRYPKTGAIPSAPPRFLGFSCFLND